MTESLRRGAGLPVLALGFRPFYLLASLYSAAAMAIWAAHYAGWTSTSLPGGSLWHAGEMLFGYTLAVVAGFLLTAVRNWTNQRTPTGPTLAAFVALWIAGRVLAFLPFPVLAAVVNAAFPVAIGLAIAVPLWRSGNRRNYFFVGLLVALGLATPLVHLGGAGAYDLPPRLGLAIGLDIVMFIVAVVGGRVIPMFTNNGIPGLAARRHPLVERAALGLLLALLAADLAALPDRWLAPLLVAAALAHAARLLLWQPWKTFGTPLVWVLHVAYAWLVVHLAMRGLAAAGAVSPLLATHALTIGVIGGMTMGMITRTARGHTGRPLRADRYETACYLLVFAAALARVAGPLVEPAAYRTLVLVSAGCWIAAFLLYFIRYWPVLTRPRVDGRPG